MRNKIDLSREPLDCVVMALLDTQNQIMKASGVMEDVRLDEEIEHLRRGDINV